MRLTGEAAEAVKQLGTLPERLREFVPDQVPVPAPGSPLSTAISEVGADDHRRRMLTEIASRGWVSVQVTTELVAAMRQLLWPRWESPLATAIIARSALEIGGHAVWLLDEGIGVDRRMARYLALAASETQKGKGFLNKAHADSPHLRHELRSGTKPIRRATDGQVAFTDATGISPVTLPDPGEFGAMVESESEYSAYSGAVHGSVAGWNEITKTWAGDEANVLLYRMIRAVGRAHILAVSSLVCYVVGSDPPDAFRRRVEAFTRDLGLEPPLSAEEIATQANHSEAPPNDARTDDRNRSGERS